MKKLHWPQRHRFHLIAYEEMLIADLYGRLEVARRYEGHQLAEDDPATWVKLPPKAAIAHFKRRMGKVMTKAAFNRLTDAMKTRAFTVAYLQQDYQLDKVRQVLQDAISKGRSMSSVVSGLREDFAKWGVTRSSKHHLETVFTTNVLGSYQHGRFKQMSSASMRRRRPYWEYSTAGDRRVRPSHQEMEGKVYPQNHPIWSTWYPPNGFRCRCTVHPLSKLEVEREGLEILSKAPKVEPDKGFKTNTGAWLKQRPKKPKVLDPLPSKIPEPA